MTIEWILGLIRPVAAIVNSNSGAQNIVSNNNQNHLPSSDVPMNGGGGIVSGSDLKLSDFRPINPILTNQYPGSPVNNQFDPNNHPLFRDGYADELKLPVFTPGYPAFFLLVLLVSLTTFAIFLLLFLCCLDAQDLQVLTNSRLLVINSRNKPRPVPEPEPEPEPLFKDVSTETDDPSPDSTTTDEDGDFTGSDVTEITEVAEAEDTVVVTVPVEDAEPGDCDAQPKSDA